MSNSAKKCHPDLSNSFINDVTGEGIKDFSTMLECFTIGKGADNDGIHERPLNILTKVLIDAPKTL